MTEKKVLEMGSIWKIEHNLNLGALIFEDIFTNEIKELIAGNFLQATCYTFKTEKCKLWKALQKVILNSWKFLVDYIDFWICF